MQFVAKSISNLQSPISIALLSTASLLLEIALTRLFAALFYPPTVFAILSLAILGIGIGAAAAAIWPHLQGESRVPTYLTLAALSALLIPIAAALLPGSLQPLLFLPIPLPYAFTGLTLATLFAARPTQAPRLYLADLLGAGLGALAAVPILNHTGPLNATFVAAALFSAAGMLFLPRISRILRINKGSYSSGEAPTAPTTNQPTKNFVSIREIRGKTPISNLQSPLTLLLISLLLLTTNTTLNYLNPTLLSTGKPIVESLQPGGALLHTEWTAFARTDLVDPGDGGPYRLYMDGAAGSVMPPATNNDFLWRDIGLFPFATAQPQRVFVIGPGGGLDVWFGLQSGAEEIVAVEVNQASIDIVRQYGDYNGHLYEQPQVRLVQDEGRSVLRRENRQYDLIFLSQVVTLAAERSGYTLVEESAYTVEAFADYLDHLRPDGQLALKLYDEPTLTRALSTALAALRDRGLTDAEALQHVMVFLDPRANPPVPLLIVRNTPYTEEDSLALGAVAQRQGFAPLYLPRALVQPPLDAVASGETSFSDIVAQSSTDISPTTDNRPFFYQFERGLPTTLRPLLAGMALVILADALFLIISHRRRRWPRTFRLPLYFAALGLGFIIIEIAIIQQVRLFLGHPTLAVTTVLAVLLIGGGLGSALAGRLWPQPQRLPPWPALLVAALSLLWLLLWPLLASRYLSAPSALRVTLVAATLLPLSLVIGMPFPLGLRRAGLLTPRDVALAWSANGIMSVAGSITAIAIALLSGYTAVLLVGVGLYVVAAGLVGWRLEIGD